MNFIYSSTQIWAAIVGILGMGAFGMVGKTVPSGMIVGLWIGGALGGAFGFCVGAVIEMLPSLTEVLIALIKCACQLLLILLLATLTIWAFSIEFGG